MARDLQQQPDGLKRALQERERLLVENAEWIGGRVATLLEHYYQPDQDDAVIAAAAGDWVEVLGGFPRDVIQKACLEYLTGEPRRRPTPGAIYAIARRLMPAPRVVPQAEPAEKPQRVTPERAAEIMAQAGFKPRRFE